MPNTIYEDVLEWARTIDVTGDIAGVDRLILRDLEKRCHCPYEAAGTLERVIEVQETLPGGHLGGTFAVKLRKTANGASGVDFPQISTAPIVWNATAGVIQAAIDITGPLVWGDYVDGDIAVTGGPAGDGGADFTYTYSGRSVEGRHANLAIDHALLTGGSGSMTVSQVTDGVSARFWFAALKQMGIISGLPDPFISDVPAGQYTINPRNEVEDWPRNETIRALVREATVREFEDWETEILVPLNIQF